MEEDVEDVNPRDLLIPTDWAFGSFTWKVNDCFRPSDELAGTKLTDNGIFASRCGAPPGFYRNCPNIPSRPRKTVYGMQPSESRHVPLPLRDFYVSMPNLVAQDMDLSCLPHQVKVALSFLKAVCPREIVTDETASKLHTFLPPPREDHRGKRTLVLDLDETLVHCHQAPVPGAPPPSLQVRIESSNLVLDAHVYVRPFTQQCLEVFASLYEVVVFTASASIYADKVLDFLDPERRMVTHRLYREHCTEIYGGHFKDVRRLGRRIEDVVLVDNSPLAIGLAPDNGILVSSWFGDDFADTELLDLTRVLEQCSDPACPSIPEFLAARYGVSRFLKALRATAAQSHVQPDRSSLHTGQTAGPVTQVTRS